MRQSAGGVMGSAAESRKRGRGHAGYQKWLAPRGLGRGRGTSARDTYRPASILIELVERLSTRGDVLLRERHLRVAKEDSLRSRTAGMSQRLSLRQLLVRLVLRHGSRSPGALVGHRVGREHESRAREKCRLQRIIDASASLLTARSVDSKKDGALPLHSLGWWIPPPRQHARARGALSAPARRSPPTRHRIQHQTTPFDRTARKLGLTPFPRPFPAADGRFLPDRVSRVPP